MRHRLCVVAVQMRGAPTLEETATRAWPAARAAAAA